MRWFEKLLKYLFGTIASGAVCFLIISADKNLHKVHFTYFFPYSFRDQNLIPAPIPRSFRDFLPGSDKRIYVDA